MTSEETPREHPLWETLVLLGSFALLWGWMLARHSAALRAPVGFKPVLWPGWNASLTLAVVALIVVMVRRMRRFKEVLRESQGLKTRPPSGKSSSKKLPPRVNGHAKK